MNLSSLFLLLLFSVNSSLQFNFLVFCPLFGHSHSTFFARLADILTEAGHNVTLFTPTILSEFRNFTYTKLTKDVVHLDPSPKLKYYGDLLSGNKRWWNQEFSIFEIAQTSQFFQGMAKELHETLSQNLDVLDDLKKRNFDLLIFEPIFTATFPMMEYMEINAFVTALSITYSSTMSTFIGEPAMPSFIPNMMAQSSDKMSLWERFLNTAIQVSTDIIFPLLPEEFPSYSGKYLNVAKLFSQSSFCFMNSNPYIEFPRPTLAKNIQIGGISVDFETLRNGKVDENWSKVLNLKKKTMLISFGSVIFSKDMPFDKKVAMASAMKKFPDVTFIWKYEDEDTDSFAKGVSNIHFAKWIPQRELLADARLSAFMTHGGLGSVNEVSYLGKPTILCPIFGDQMRNAKMLVRHNGSIEISKYELSDPLKIEQVFQKILFDQSYQIAAKRLAEQLEFQPVKPKDIFLKHAEFAARFGGLPSLDPSSRHLSFIEYFLLDLVFISIFVIVIIISFCFLLSKFVWKIWRSKRKTD